MQQYNMLMWWTTIHTITRCWNVYDTSVITMDSFSRVESAYSRENSAPRMNAPAASWIARCPLYSIVTRDVTWYVDTARQVIKQLWFDIMHDNQGHDNIGVIQQL